MTFYCKECKSLFVPGDDVNLSIDPDGEYLVKCPVCTGFFDGECEPVYMQLIPDYETPEHYGKRVGKAYPDDGGQAFPCYADSSSGMTLRDFFVGQVSGEILREAWQGYENDEIGYGEIYTTAARNVYMFADALIVEREKQRGGKK
jgi:hypothetical protein